MTTQRVFNKALLEEILLRDGATLTGKYDNFTGTTRIFFICKCGNSGDKIMKTLVYKGGAYCKDCVKINTNKKYYNEHDIGKKGYEELICKKFDIEPTHENIKTISDIILRRVYRYKYRDLVKRKRCVTIEEALFLDDYLINIIYYDWYHEDNELQKLEYLSDKPISELTETQRKEVIDYVIKEKRPLLLYKSKDDSKLLIDEIPPYTPVTYNDLCELILSSSDKCVYCNCKMIILGNTTYDDNKLTFDAIITLYGHMKDNLTVCCQLCNSKKNFKNVLEFEDESNNNDVIELI